jgi:hypothetical protein
MEAQQQKDTPALSGLTSIHTTFNAAPYAQQQQQQHR